MTSTSSDKPTNPFFIKEIWEKKQLCSPWAVEPIYHKAWWRKWLSQRLMCLSWRFDRWADRCQWRAERLVTKRHGKSRFEALIDKQYFSTKADVAIHISKIGKLEASDD